METEKQTLSRTKVQHTMLEEYHNCQNVHKGQDGDRSAKHYNMFTVFFFFNNIVIQNMIFEILKYTLSQIEIKIQTNSF